MLNSLPEETTQLLIDICTSLAPLSYSLEPDEPEAQPSRQSSTGPSYLSYLALNRVGASTPSENQQPPSSASMNTVRPGEATTAPKRDSVHELAISVSRTSTPPPLSSSTPTATPTTASATSSSKPLRGNTVKRPSPRLYFAHFIDHVQYFVRFLETVALKRWGQTVDGAPVVVETDPNADEQAEKRDQVAVWNTLLELYLTALSSSSSGVDKAMRLLQSRLPYDPTHALILCSTRGYTPGLVLLWERMGMHEDVLRFHISRARASAGGSISGDGGGDGDVDATAEVLRLLDLYGPARPKLYVLVLRFLTESEGVMRTHGKEVGRVMRRAEEEGVLSPLGAVQMLSRNGVTSVGLVKEWLLERIGQAREEVETVSSPPSFFCSGKPIC